MRNIVLALIISLFCFGVAGAICKASCDTCSGSGYCHACDGSGKASSGATCYICEGSKKCYVCEGSGDF